MPKFIVKQEGQPGREIPMARNQFLFGRTEDCDVMISDPNVSRRHAQAVLLNGLVAMVDLNSSNGTFVNGLPISRIFLMDGDEVQLGGTTFVFVEDRESFPTAFRKEAALAAPSSSPEASVGQQSVDAGNTILFSSIAEETRDDAFKEVYLKLKSLYRVFHEVIQASSLKEVFEAVGRSITLSTSIERASFFLTIEKGGTGFQKYYVQLASRLDSKLSDAGDLTPVLNRTRDDQKPVSASLVPGNRYEFDTPEPNVYSVPLLRSGKVAAVLVVDNVSSGESICKNDQDFISTLALQVSVRLNQVEQVQQLTRENVQLRRKLDDDLAIVVRNERMKQILEVATRVASSDSTVLVTGESGTGKELIAREIHRFSRRAQKPLVAVNCAALPETLLESELFGHEKGAFTGAIERRIGKFELADGGTLFLDEIGEISPSAQAKLLRVLQEGELQRVGGNKTVTVDVRLIGATNKNLAEEVRKGNFRQDLFFRLKVIEIHLPPLRERADDIPVLAEYFFKQLRQKINTTARSIAPETLELLGRYPFPGNVRELRNVIERGLVFAFGDALLPDHLPMEILQHESALGGLPPVSYAAQPGSPAPAESASADATGTPLTLAEVEKNHIQMVLKFVKGNKLKAAGLLGISRTTLYEKLKAYGLASGPEE